MQTHTGVLFITPYKGKTLVVFKGDDKQSDVNCKMCAEASQLASLSTEPFADIICHCYALLAVECASTLTEQQVSHQRSSAFTNVCCVMPKRT